MAYDITRLSIDIKNEILDKKDWLEEKAKDGNGDWTI